MKIINQTSTKLVIAAPAKINLALDVIGKLPNGYHEVRMIMQNISLFDEVTLEKSSVCSISGDKPDLPLDNTNLAIRAWQILSEKYGLTGGIKIHLAKNIPMAAGLGGGSADAAGVLLGVNKLYDLDISREELAEIALPLGADVPFATMGGTALAEGIGERLTPLPDVPEIYVLVVNPGFSVPTPDVYKNLGNVQVISHPDVDGIIQGIQKQDGEEIINGVGNVLEYSAFDLFSQLAGLKQEIADLGLQALMSGSGGTMLGFSQDQELIDWCSKRLKDKYPFVAVASTSFEG